MEALVNAESNLRQTWRIACDHPPDWLKYRNLRSRFAADPELGPGQYQKAADDHVKVDCELAGPEDLEDDSTHKFVTQEQRA
jgi:hypothetical protein